MKGKILDYSVQESKGIISAENGKRYNFTNIEWKSTESPSVNQNVDFETDGDIAKDIYLIKSSANTDGVIYVNNAGNTKGFSEYISYISKNGMQNKFAFFSSILLAIFMFIPIVEEKNLMGIFHGVSLYQFRETFSIYAFICILISAGLFYIGAKQIFVKLTTIIYTILLFLIFKELYTIMSTFKSFTQINFAMFIFIFLLIINISLAFSKKYKETNSTFAHKKSLISYI